MSECLNHELAFGGLRETQPGTSVHLLSGKSADVVELECPTCGLKLFMYYRTATEGWTYQEPHEEGDTD